MFPTSEIYLQAELAYRRDRLITERTTRAVRRSTRVRRSRPVRTRRTRPATLAGA